ncbi:centrosomal protein of 162 kDa-like [Teleopsis dalmanni]|uniref:centrosomal protein of 162 kDa-like n=1 Tax=Teleopsis dalmanni TaxID=139649 RepID=UPI0018CFB934|nr:centrosomal protein of 162 kDa-like [Teleopsis dalmanni]
MTVSKESSQPSKHDLICEKSLKIAMEEITEGIETIELAVNDEPCLISNGTNLDTNNVSHLNSNAHESLHASNTNIALMPMSRMLSVLRTSIEHTKSDYITNRRPSVDSMLQTQQSQAYMPSPTHKSPLNFNATQACSPSVSERRNSGSAVRRSSITTPDSGIASHTHSAQFTQTLSPHKNIFSPTPTPAVVKSFSDKSVNSSPKHMVSSVTSPIESMSFMTREHVLKQEIDQLQEKLKDTEERLQSLRIQHDSLAQLHRDLRDNSSHLQEESEMLKLDVQHLTECANVLRTELKAARNDRSEALELQKALQTELEETRQDKKRAQELKEKDTKVIQDLQRQCREMERILMRKHPDSVSALIVASKNPGKCTSNDQENLNSRKLLEQRIAQLEADAKAQDLKAQQILANVQARFNSVQAKYETHIADLETQVLSLQEINTKLNEKIESQVRTLDYFVSKKSEQYYNNSTQTDDIKIVEEETENTSSTVRVTTSACTQTANTKTSTRDHSTNTIGTSNQHSASSTSPTTDLNDLRQTPVSYHDHHFQMSAYTPLKKDAHLLATLAVFVDLPLRKPLSADTQMSSWYVSDIATYPSSVRFGTLKSDKPHSTPSTLSRRHYDASHNADQTPANTESQALKEAQNKIKLLEADYKTLHDKRLQDLKSLQTAHERELASCHETVRILQQRLNERDEAFALQKRRKMPVDYYALKAKVSSLERRHSEREERLHMLVEALSKGRLNGALEEMIADNNNK